jgi:FkbM family methyltransferase
MNFFYNQIRNGLRNFGIEVVKSSTLQGLEDRANDRSSFDLKFILSLEASVRSKSIELLTRSNSQLRQDLFVLAELNFKTEGYYVEFGATDGITLSNTFLLGSEFLWNGILAEPAKCYKEKLFANRPNATLDFSCVWSLTGQRLDFFETSEPELSTIADYAEIDLHAKSRKERKSYQVETISLLDLLRKHNAPNNIDYLSIDTEGSEYEILSAFDFDSYRFGVITVEHNNTSNRKKIFELLSSQGYERKLSHLTSFDDWYVSPSN